MWREPWDDAPYPSLDAEQLAAVIARHQLPVDAATVERLPSVGIVNAVYALGDRWVLRVPKALDDAVCDTLTESVAVPVARAAGVRTPALVAFDDSRDIVGVPYSIYERCGGSALVSVGADAGTLAAVWFELGRDLATLHHGVTTCADPDGRLDHPGRDDEYRPLLDAAIAEGTLNADNAATLAGWFERLAPAARAGAAFRRFLHDDAQPANVMATDGTYVALIDWGDAGWGDPALDFRSLPARAVPHALRGYRSVAPIDGDDTAEARIWWDHLYAAVYGARRSRVAGRTDWNRPTAARLVELLALLADGGVLGRFS